MPTPTAYDQLGRYVVKFQHLERQLTSVMELLAGEDPVVTAILTTELGFAARVRTVDVLFSYFLSIRTIAGSEAEKLAFHKVCSTLIDLAPRRNELVHSVYTPWLNVHGTPGLIRKNARLSSSKGVLLENEEEILPDTLDAEMQNLSSVSMHLEAFRLKMINWQYAVEA
jgi:hypothetical protein